MDDQQTYLLNGLITRHFGVGRIVRFRQVQRGRQAESFELFTAQEKEYLVHLYAPSHSADHLNFTAKAVNALDKNRFSVMPFLPSKQVSFVAEGPQGRHMLLGLAPAGSLLAPADYTDHDISQVGLRLAWMHRLLKEQIPEPANPLTTADRFYDRFLDSGPPAAPGAERPAGERPAPSTGGKFLQLYGLVRMSNIHGWVHGDITPASLLHDSDRQLRTVTDWALLHWGCPLEDLVDAFIFLSTSRDGMLDRGRGAALLEAYNSLIPVQKMAWTPVVASWCAQRMLTQERRDIAGESFLDVMREPERLAMAMSACIG